MIWLLLAIIFGLCAAGIVTGGALRTHDEMPWLNTKKACRVCETPRSGLDLVPFLGDVLMAGRCRHCKTSSAWHYLFIELFIVAATVFHVWRYVEGVWIPYGSEELIWFWAVRDVAFTLFLIIIFVYDFKYSLILDKYTIPAMVVAFVLNLILGYEVINLVFGALLLGLFFWIQYTLSKGMLLGGGDVRMGIVMGLMLGAAGGVLALALTYAIGALVGLVLVLSKRHTLRDRVPLGTFLSVATFVILVWADPIVSLVL